MSNWKSATWSTTTAKHLWLYLMQGKCILEVTWRVKSLRHWYSNHESVFLYGDGIVMHHFFVMLFKFVSKRMSKNIHIDFSIKLNLMYKLSLSYKVAIVHRKISTEYIRWLLFMYLWKLWFCGVFLTHVMYLTQRCCKYRTIIVEFKPSVFIVLVIQKHLKKI